ncbi:hypothetical protein [uncultured Pseudacidovorax sp.]|uniref:hypothetical protein n=1 Tax=uncultured Pseudacidovorax sp. TaxID=679313 RepID=UPI0025E431DF|nr:hypothetical protein [uncultured Pseudacidovorax sp.]
MNASMDEWMVIAGAVALLGLGGALGATVVLALGWRRLCGAAAQVLEARLAPQFATLRQEQQRVPQSVQQAIQVELEFHSREQAEREGRQSADLREYLRAALAAYGWTSASPLPPVPTPAPAAPAWPPVAGPGVAPPVPGSEEAAQAAQLAREKEWAAARARQAMSDDAIDALPPDLPAPSRAARRPLVPPRGIPAQRL